MSLYKNTLLLESIDYSEKSIKAYQSIGKLYTLNPGFINYSDINILIIRLGTFIDNSFLAKFPNLEIIASPTTSLTHIDISVINNESIKIFSLRDCFDKILSITSTSELTVGLTIDLVRRISSYSNSILTESVWNRDLYKTRQISSMSIGIIGLGRVGNIVANVFNAFGSNVTYCDIDERVESDIAERVNKNKLLSSSDIIILCASWFHNDPCILDEDDFALIKANTLIVNSSRAEVINHKCLIKSIKSRKISGYATDVLPIQYENNNVKSHELLKLYKEGYNIIITPHIGGRTTDAMSYTEDCIADLVLSHYKL